MIEALLTSQPTRVMGIVNVTPDSFSDGGDYASADDAVARGRELVAEGAALVDVGGESTRPGAARVDQDEELRRVLPVVSQLAADGVAVSVDTMRAEVARQCVAAGAIVVNDVSGGLADPTMLGTVAELGCGYVIMHWRGHSDTMAKRATYDDVVADVTEELRLRVRAAVIAGIEPERLILDPGIGFAKTFDQNWELLRHSDRIAELGLPVCWGVSRKGFLGALSPHQGAAKDRDPASVALTALLAERQVWAVRTHTAAAHVAAVAAAHAMGAAR